MSGLSGFAAGFAQGFINERNRRLDKENELDKMSLQYRLKELADQKDTWQKKQAQEAEWVQNGKNLAQTLGDPDFANAATRMLSAGIDANTIMERYQKGNFKKVTPDEQTFAVTNPELQVNNVQSNLIKTPMDNINPPDSSTTSTNDAVYNPKVVPPAVTNTGLQTQTPAVAQNTPKKKGLFGITADDFKINDDPNNIDINKVNSEAKQIAPGLFDFDATKHNADFQKILDTPGSNYKFIPDTVQDKVGTLSQEINNFQSAQQLGDKISAAKAQQHINAIKQSMQIEAQYKAKENGIMYNNMAIVDQNGKWVDNWLVGDDPNTGKPVNLVTGKEVTLSPGMHMVPMSDKTADDIRNTQSKFQEIKSKYDTATSSTAEAFRLGRETIDLLNKPGNDTISSGAADWTRLVGDVWANVKGAKDAIDSQIEAATKSSESGDQTQLSKDIGNLENGIKSFESKIPSTILSDRNAQIVIDKTLLKAKMTLLAYKISQANGVTGNNASNKDVANFLSVIGNDNSTNQATEAALTSLLQNMKIRMDQSKAQLDSVGKQYTKTYGFDIGLEGTRMGDIITPPGQKWTPDQIADRKFYDGISNLADQYSKYTSDTYNAAKAASPNNQIQQQQDTTPVEVQTKQGKFNTNTTYTTPSGKKVQVDKDGNWFEVK